MAHRSVTVVRLALIRRVALAVFLPGLGSLLLGLMRDPSPGQLVIQIDRAGRPMCNGTTMQGPHQALRRQNTVEPTPANTVQSVFLDVFTT